MAQLLEKGNGFDLIFIDGMHLFDYTLVDIYFSVKLLKINGIIVIDDALHPGVQKCVNYFDSNYKFYKKLESPVTLASYQKISDDNRDWNFHQKF